MNASKRPSPIWAMCTNDHAKPRGPRSKELPLQVGIEVWPPLRAPPVPTAIAVSVGKTSDFRAALT